jgi:hypothetical protein
MIQKWLLKAESYGIQLQQNLKITTLSYADDQVILSNDEDNLQRATKHLNDIAKEYGMKINTSKTKSMVFKGKNIQRAKTVIDNKIIE